jgi:hypothetical protein
MRRAERRPRNLLPVAGFVGEDVYAASGASGLVQGAPSSSKGVLLMKTVLKLAALACVVSLGACNRSATENKADNLEATVENVADNLETMSGNVSNGQIADNLQNSADRVRDAGSNAADAVRDAGRNTNNVESNTVGM